jgi:hypothetical protein
MLHQLLLGNKALAKLPIWLQEKMQDEFEAQEELERKQQPYSYPSQALLRATDAPNSGPDSLLRPARGSSGVDDRQLLRAQTPETRE